MRILKDPNNILPDVIVYDNKCERCGKEFESVEEMRYCVYCEEDILCQSVNSVGKN